MQNPVANKKQTKNVLLTIGRRGLTGGKGLNTDGQADPGGGLTKAPLRRQESSFSAGEELSTYSTMLTPRPPFSERGDSTEPTSLPPWKPWPGRRCTMIG